jgi:hypothetical protein
MWSNGISIELVTEEQDVKMCIRLHRLRWGPVSGFCEHSTEPSEGIS